MAGTARLLTASATTGWTDWTHGQLWLRDDGLLRTRTDLAARSGHGSAPTVSGDEPVTIGLTRAEAEREASQHRRNVWVPREEVVSAVLRGGLSADSLRLRRQDGRTTTLRWRRRDAAYGPLKEALQDWLGPGLELKGRRRQPNPPEPPHAPSRAGFIVGLVVNLAIGVLVVALYAGWLDPLLGARGGETTRGCDDLAPIAEGRRETPEPGAEPHSWATRTHQTPVDRALVPFLLETVDHGTYVRTHEQFWNLDGHADTQHNPEARELAAEHGFVRQVSRRWTDEDGNAISHTITQLSSPANAESFDLQVARYSCRFAEQVREVPLGEGHTPGIGQRILYADGAVAEQVAWTRDGRRHLLAVHHQGGEPERELVERLVARAHPQDDGADVVAEVSSPGADD